MIVAILIVSLLILCTKMGMIRPQGKAKQIYESLKNLEEYMPRKKQGYNARLDESLGMRHKGRKKQSLKARRDESKGMEKALKRPAYAAVKTMDRGSRKKK